MPKILLEHMTSHLRNSVPQPIAIEPGELLPSTDFITTMNNLRITAAPRSIRSCLLARSSPGQFTPPTLFILQQCRTNQPPSISAITQQVRHRSWFGWPWKKDEDRMPSAGSESRSLKELLKASPKSGAAAQSHIPTFDKGGLASSSLFASEPTAQEPVSTGVRSVPDSEYLVLVDPRRATSWSWPKRFEARQYRRRGRLTRKMQILQTEKSHTAKSHWIKTSVKKLVPLARQITGMNLNDAIVQMRFSAKKPSTDIMNLLGEARMEAIVRRGMKDGNMYVSEAWVGRGAYEKEMSHRARGRIDMLRKPYTSITVVLKENATRDRIAREKQEKADRKKVWVQLPNRPIYGQQQYYQW